MPAPYGNKNAVGNGRPPNPGYSDEELLKLGKELLKWMKKVDDENIEVFHLSEWYSRTKEIPYSQWKSLINRSCFLPYYEKALDWMGTKTLKNRDLPSAYGSRFIGMYFKDLREFEREEKHYEAVNINKEISDEDRKEFIEWKLQKIKSALDAG